MPSLKDIRKRITSVKNTQKITRAMKLVAAAKLRRAQDAITAARPYSVALSEVVSELAEAGGGDSHPLLESRDGTRTEIVLMTSDRGLAGSFNSQLTRAVSRFADRFTGRSAGPSADNDLGEADSLVLRVIGRKGREYFTRRGTIDIGATYDAATSPTALDLSRQLANEIVEEFTKDRVDRVFVAFNEFKSAMTQIPKVVQLLPVQPVAAEEGQGERLPADFIFEPGRAELLEHLLPLYIQNGLFRACLESVASEFGSRMSAMDSATRNAGEMIDRLTLDFNRARQAAITKELLEIIGGAEALKG